MPGLVQGILSYNGRVYATFNPSDKGATGTLSSGNLVFTGTGSNSIVRSTIGKSTGRWYMGEFTLTSISSQNPKIGIALDTGVNMNGFLGAGNSIGYRGTPWCITGPSSLQTGTGLCSAQVTGQLISVSVDLLSPTKVVKFYLNGVEIPSSITISAGTWYAAGAVDSTAVITANFGQNEWSTSTSSLRATLAASGFNIGLY